MLTKIRTLILTAILLASSLVAAGPASSSLISKFQAQSPVSIYIPANQPVPAQGSTVTFSYDRDDFTGSNAASNYNSALNVATTATVTYVVADLGYRAYNDVGTIATAGDLGYLVLLDFGSGQSFTYAYVGYVTFSSAATAVDASGVGGAYSYNDGGTAYVWLPSSVSLAGVTAVLDSWSFQQPRQIASSVSNHVLDCSKVSNSSTCNNLSVSERTGTLLTMSGGTISSQMTNAFFGLVGRSSQIQGGLVQTSLVPGGSSGESQQTSSPRYSGPEFYSFGSPTVSGAKVLSAGKKLDSITSMKINGAAVTYKVNSANELEIELPKDLAPGKYDVEITSTHGKLTHLQGITIKALVPTKEISFKGDGAWLNYGSLIDLTNAAKQIGSDYTSVKCIVNAADPAVAERLAKRACSYIEANRLRGKAVTYESKSTFKGEGFWVRIVANG